MRTSTFSCVLETCASISAIACVTTFSKVLIFIVVLLMGQAQVTVSIGSPIEGVGQGNEAEVHADRQLGVVVGHLRPARAAIQLLRCVSAGSPTLG